MPQISGVRLKFRRTMPQISERQQLLRFVEQKLELDILGDSSGMSDSDISNSEASTDLSGSEGSVSSFDVLDSSSDEDDHFMENGGPDPGMFELFFIMNSTRYFISQEVTPKSKDFIRNFFCSFPDRMFRQLTRMDKRSFFYLADLIAGDPIFQTRCNHSQMHIEIQLAVTLDQLGHEGIDACLLHMIPTWGVSNGSICKFTTRCFIALENALYDAVTWPTAAERQSLSVEFAKLGFPGCVGLIDGSLLPLSQRPRDDGMPGSCQDITVLRKSPFWPFLTHVEANSKFDDGQYLLGDSGYVALPHVVSAFKRSDVPNKADFNTCVAKCRVTNEHCIGVLKARWHSLRELRVQLNSPRHHSQMVRWINMCAKLHNFVIKMNDEWTDVDSPIELEDSTVDPGTDIVTVSQRRVTAAGNQLLARVMEIALQHHRQPGGFLHIPGGV